MDEEEYRRHSLIYGNTKDWNSIIQNKIYEFYYQEFMQIDNRYENASESLVNDLSNQGDDISLMQSVHRIIIWEIF